MYLWDDVVGSAERRMLKLPRKSQVAYGIVCADGALARMSPYLAERVPRKNYLLAKAAVNDLWEFLMSPGIKGKLQNRADEIDSIMPEDDDLKFVPGWGEILESVHSDCEMVNGEPPKELLADCISYAYQGVLEMAIVIDTRRARTTEAAVRDFEEHNERCRSEMAFQLHCLEILEQGDEVRSALFSGRSFTPK